MRIYYILLSIPLLIFTIAMSDNHGMLMNVAKEFLTKDSSLILQKSVVHALVLCLSQIDQSILDQAIDIVCGGVRAIPDFQEIFLPDSAMYMISLEGISMRGLTSLKRCGDLTKTSSSKELDLSFPVSLTNFQINIDQTRVNLMLYKTNGSMLITIRDISFTTYLRFSATSDCALNIRKIQMNTLNGIDINTYGNVLLGLAARYARYEEDVKRLVQKGIDKAIKQMVKDKGHVVCAR